jgi:hypothetical protein
MAKSDGGLPLAFAAALVVVPNPVAWGRQHTTPSPAATVPGHPPAAPAATAFRLSREDEDWSFLRDPAVRAARQGTPTGRFDRLKHLPLGGDGRASLSLGGEFRPYAEGFANENWGAGPARRDAYLLQRFMLHADVRAADGRARAFVQFKSGAVSGRSGGPRPPDRDDLDINQLFVDAPLGAGAVLRLGRQEMNYGAGRLISVREGPNVRVGFDGARAIWNAGRSGWRTDLFAVRPVRTGFGAFDDRPNWSDALAGVYAAGPLGSERLDVYVLRSERRRARFDQGAGTERRDSIGARLSSAPGGGGRPFDYDLEVTGQYGAFGARAARGRVRAWSVAGTAGYTLGRARWRPRVGIDAGATSGDRDPDAPDVQTFAPPAPRGSYFGQIGANGPQNSVGFSPTLGLHPRENVSAAAGCYFFWRQSVRDGLYGVPGNLLRSGRGSDARFVGTQPQVEVTWRADPYTSFTLNYARFFAGRFLRETGPSRNIDYFAAWMTFRF